MSDTLYCPKCRSTLKNTNFYKKRDGTFHELCKNCLTMHINNYDEESFKWLIKEFDVPYLPWIWKKVREKEFEKNLNKVSANPNTSDPKTAAYNMTRGTSVVFGKYLGQMKLVQWKKFTWVDTDELIARNEEKAKMTGTLEGMEDRVEEMKKAYENGEISEAQYLTFVDLNPVELEVKSLEERFFDEGGPAENGPTVTNPAYPANDNPFEKVDIPDVGAELTDEDKIYLAMKWGRLYTAADWVTLEQKYAEYEQSFDLHNADLISGTKQLCKLDLKSNQALDTGDIDSYSKLARASDALRKSLKFTEAQRKEDAAKEFDCYGVIVKWAEENNDEDYIRPINLNIDRDIVDTDLKDIKNFTQDLIKEDPAVYKMVEQYIKKRENLEEQEKNIQNGTTAITDQDLKDFNDFIENEKREDEEE